MQNLPWVVDRFKDQTFYVTEKLDGTSATYFFNKGKFGVCSRKLQLHNPKSKYYWEVALKYGMEKVLKAQKTSETELLVADYESLFLSTDSVFAQKDLKIDQMNKFHIP